MWGCKKHFFVESLVYITYKKHFIVEILVYITYKKHFFVESLVYITYVFSIQYIIHTYLVFSIYHIRIQYLVYITYVFSIQYISHTRSISLLKVQYISHTDPHRNPIRRTTCVPFIYLVASGAEEKRVEFQFFFLLFRFPLLVI